LRTSTDRILTTHVGSLPRPADISDMLFRKERGEDVDDAAFHASVTYAVENAVEQQARSGVDIASDGEMSKISYATYVKDRLTGFDGDSPRRPPADLEAFPGFLQRQAKGGGTPTYRRPMCVGPIEVKDNDPLHADLDNMKLALAKAGSSGPVEGFLNAASPGVIALFQPNSFYPSQEAYLEALANAMASEYRAIVEAGFILQVDSPDLGLGRHMMFKAESEETYVRSCEQHVEALNAALAGLPRDRVRLHVCWGNYEGPHHCDAPLSTVLPIAMKANVGAILFEAANPRHGHEWTWFQDNKIPDDLIIIPGVIDSTTNFIEHPELVAQRIERFASLVGRERVIAGADCGFSTFAGFGAVDPDIVWAKLQTMADGAAIASKRLWGRV
jgi:5-methyltetrahydropteroyltriglutamate--homocysteine methyltransferase